MSLRLVIALVVAAIACLVGALILGEYEFTGATPWGAGILFGLVISEIVIEIGRRRGLVLGVICGGMAAAALARAAYTSSGDGLRAFPTGGWVAMVVAALTTGVRLAWPVRAPRDDVTAAD